MTAALCNTVDILWHVTYITYQWLVYRIQRYESYGMMHVCILTTCIVSIFIGISY